MTTTDNVLLIILTSLLSLFFLLGCVVLALVIKLINSAREVMAKAGSVVETVEEAAEIFKDTQGKMAFFKLARNIVKLAKKKGRR